MKKWFHKIFCKWTNSCPRCGFFITNGSITTRDFIKGTIETTYYQECPNCKKKSPEFLELYDLLEKGIK